MTIIESIDCSRVAIHELPAKIASVRTRMPPLVKITNLPVEPVFKRTPSHWREECGTPNDELFHQISSMFGHVFGYSDLQDGRLLQEIFPIRGDENKQVGSGSSKLELHTEDPSLEYRADYLGFLCISNIDKVPTIVSVPDFSHLSEAAFICLTTQRFQILSDRPSNPNYKNQDLLTPVLIRDETGHVRFIYDPVYINYEAMNARQKDAFGELQDLVESSVIDFLLGAGEIGFIDNYQVAHGRPQYSPRYDGTDRWLKRTQISNNFSAVSHLATSSGDVMP
jgi:L-asparagine oxygenase